MGASHQRADAASTHAERVPGVRRRSTASLVRERASTPDQAEEIISRHYLPNRLYLPPRTERLTMELAGFHVGATTTGRLSYGQRVQQRTAEASHFHVNMPVRGHAVSTSGKSEPLRTTAGQGLVFSPGVSAEIEWSPDCIQLCLMIPRAGLEAELERLLGRTLRSRLRFEFGIGTAQGAERLNTVLQLLAQELDSPSALTLSRVAGRHVEAVVFDALLLGYRHNYTEVDADTPNRATGGAINKAVELMEDQPSVPWTTLSLSRELHLSIRALQAGFKRELDVAPMAYLRMVRLRRAHDVLEASDPGSTTVQAVAASLGLLHPGRFASHYRAAFGEMPSETLHR
jgi:AraC-like DNA-binding protein